MFLESLWLLKEIGEDKLRQESESSKIIKVIEEAEATFIDSSLTDRFGRIENCLDVINKRAKGVFLFIEYILKKQKTCWIQLSSSVRLHGRYAQDEPMLKRNKPR
ncbi:MAG: hypothetical protein HY578_09525 [Nitrospinae bacterium]|nr:hypothetical protein [Nitrospinota bacterium]